jgi:P-aminobenzoate N-oxygenase AurF
MHQQYSYAEVLSASERFGWRVDDLIGGDKRLDFSKPFLPDSLARTRGLDFLTPEERRVMNQIRGAGYLYMFGLVEEFILPFVLDHVRPQLGEDDCRVRAFLGFAAEEAKHIQLFHRFREEFENGFGSECGMIGPPDAIAGAVLSHHPLAVSLAILHIEWMTQRHFLDSVQDDQALDPQFKSLLRHHWMEEVRHAKLDTLMAEAIADACSVEERAEAIDGYLDIGGFLDGGLARQVELDLESFIRATGRRLGDAERTVLIDRQRQALRWTFIGSGMSHPNFLATADHLRPGARERLEAIVPTFC